MTDVIISVRTAEPRGSMQDGGPKVMLPPVDMEKGLKKKGKVLLCYTHSTLAFVYRGDLVLPGRGRYLR